MGNHAQLHFRQKSFFLSKNGGGGFVRERRLPKLKEKKLFFPELRWTDFALPSFLFSPSTLSSSILVPGEIFFPEKGKGGRRKRKMYLLERGGRGLFSFFWWW